MNIHMLCSWRWHVTHLSQNHTYTHAHSNERIICWLSVYKVYVSIRVRLYIQCSYYVRMLADCADCERKECIVPADRVGYVGGGGGTMMMVAMMMAQNQQLLASIAHTAREMCAHAYETSALTTAIFTASCSNAKTE